MSPTDNTETPASERSRALEAAPDETSRTSPSISRNRGLHLPTRGDRTLHRRLRVQILLRDNNTCASCGYTSPHPRGHAMKIAHEDGNASNNDPKNLRVHCPPCEAIRHCGLSGSEGWIVLGESRMEQVEIVRRTREIFETLGVIPHPRKIDPSVTQTPVERSAADLANLLKPAGEDLPAEYSRLRGFFTKDGAHLFNDTTITANVEASDAAEESNPSDRRAAEILALEASLPWICYSPRNHKSAQAYLDTWSPSLTTKDEVAWICVDNPRTASGKGTRPDSASLKITWDEICASNLASIPEVDKLARRFGTLSGKWLVFATTAKVDSLWERIVKATLSGTLGTSAKVSPRDETSSHVICVYNDDYMSRAEVDKIRDGLRRLGVKKRIGYKPDIYTYCGIYAGNSWGIAPTRYHS